MTLDTTQSIKLTCCNHEYTWTSDVSFFLNCFDHYVCQICQKCFQCHKSSFVFGSAIPLSGRKLSKREVKTIKTSQKIANSNDKQSILRKNLTYLSTVVLSLTVLIFAYKNRMYLSRKFYGLG